MVLEILQSHPQVETRDAFLTTTKINNGIKEIISTDIHFELISAIKRIDRGEFNEHQ